jgi:trans-AT polyketide synthase/acyltransferase/oxidoreductase domain-containing protein
MFSGQGSQTYQMGRELYDNLPVFRAWMRRLDGVVERCLGWSLLDRLYDEGAERQMPFTCLLETHPALFMVRFSLAKAVEDAGIHADMVLGSSLGEWVALSLAGAMPPEELLVLIIEMAKLIERQCPEDWTRLLKTCAN